MYSYLNPLPPFMNGTAAKWAYISLGAIAAVPGQFNRSALKAPWEATDVSDPALAQTLNFLNTTEFVAYDDKFFDLLGPDATIEISPTYNAHGCVYSNHSLYVVTDGYREEQSGQLVKIDPHSLKQEILLNNYLVQPFDGFKAVEIDPRGNFYLTDSKSGWGREIVNLGLPTNPTVYFVEQDTFRIKPLHITDGNANGIAISPSGDTLYIPDTGVSGYYPRAKSPYGKRDRSAFDISKSGSVLSNRRLLSNPISYFYDGIRVSRNGWIFCGAGDGVDVIDPETGFTLGTIRVGGGENIACLW